jgi:membrane dipeptidase
MPIIIDAHEDLAYNMLTHGRDYRRSVGETRRLEANTEVPGRTGHTLLGWPEYQRGQVAVVFATIFLAPQRYQGGDWETQVYSDFAEAEHLIHTQFDLYQRLTGDHPDMFRLIRSRKDLAEVCQRWEERPAVFPPSEANGSERGRSEAGGEVGADGVADTATNPVGLVLSLEGAEGLAHPEMLEEFWELGLRLVGPVWAGTRLFGGTMEPGDMTREGQALLEVMADLGYTLDIAHMNDQSALRAIDTYTGPVIASHANARALLRDQANERHLADLTIRRLVERGGIVGVLPFNRFLKASWKLGDDRQAVRLDDLAAHIDHICQIAGDSDHVGLGTDFDGGFGWPAVPAEVDDISDLQKLASVLEARGYAPADVAQILGGNWRRHLERTLPES